MQDSLDLVQLKEDADTLKCSARRRWNVLAGIIILMLFSCSALTIIPPFLNPIRADAKEKCSATCMLSTQICINVPTVFLVGGAIILFWNWRQQRSYAKRRTLHELNLDLPTVSNPYLIAFTLNALLWSIFWLGMTFVYPSAASFYGFMILLPFPFILFFNWIIRFLLYRCKYDDTLSWVHFLKRRWVIGNDMSLICIEALTLLHAGRAEESEKQHLYFLAQTKQAGLSEPTALNNLGCELIFQERYQEAMPILENAILKQPTFGSAYDSLAALYLESGTNPQRALELAEIAVTHAPRGAASVLLSANLARALALMGLSTRAEITLRAALKKMDKSNNLVASEIQRIAGHTMQALGNQEAAREHFAKAVQSNPHGRIGSMAQRALDDMALNP